MDKNTIAGLVLIFAIFLGFSLYNSNKLKKSHDSAVERADSLYNKGQLEAARTEYRKALQYKPGSPESVEKVNEINAILQPQVASDTTAQNRNVADIIRQEDKTVITAEPQTDPLMLTGDFASAYTGTQDFITLSNSKLELKVSTKGGRIYSARLKEYFTFDSRPVILFDGDSTVFGFNFFTNDNRGIRTNDLYFTPYETEGYIDASTEQGKAVLRLYADESSYIEYTYTIEPDSYMIGFDVRFIDMGSKIAANLSTLIFDWQAYIPQMEKGRQNENNYTQIKYKHYQDEFDGFRERSQKEFEEAEIPTKLRWVAFKDQFFSTVLIAEENFSNGIVSMTNLDESTKYLKLFTSELGLQYDPGSTTSYDLKLYIGPNHVSTLQEYGYNLNELVFLGRNVIRFINRYVIITLFNWLNNFIGNYGLIILILTLIIKLVLFPLTFKSFQSQAKMKVLKPMVDEINKKFPKKEDAMKKQQATMDLYKRAGVSPLGGCLPMALQMPILFAMFRFFPTSIELRQEGFLWAADLSTYDSIIDLPFTIPMYGDHVSLFTLLMTVSTILTMKLNSPAQTGQEQMPGMKMMMYMMPIMFMLILNNYSSGLTYYYFLANIITFGQNMLSKRFINDEEVLKKLESGKKTPKKKSSFQKRLEEAARQRGYRPKK
ncbi:MAG TPA: membrane protein insertase YidC [Bacteroidales bacterium]|nr:membrane protein insertase YidC [Bacteroidales bacterium]